MTGPWPEQISYLPRHLDYLLTSDVWFMKAWRLWDANRRSAFLHLCHDLDDVANDIFLAEEYQTASSRYRRMFLLIPEYMIPESPSHFGEWLRFATEVEEQETILKTALRYVHDVLQTAAQRPIKAHVYGGLKDIAHLVEVPTNDKIGASSLSRAVGDLWDLVRLRIVVPSSKELILVALRLWELHLDDIIKARNYYLYPRASTEWSTHPYRAIHLQLPILNRMIEVQIMTEAFEAICYLDHAVLFKRRIPPLDARHRDWLQRIRASGIVLDARRDRPTNATDVLQRGLVPGRRLFNRRTQ